jgi:uncharacterized protein YdeI (YjbR/CyaY-like superfamily)
MPVRAALLPPDAVQPKDRAAWRAWLTTHHASATGVWAVTFKKSAGKHIVTYDDLVEEALCVGWVDSRPRALDAERTMLWFAPRKAGSGWSRPNKERIARLTAASLMLPAGQAKVDAALADGSWEKLDAVEALELPADLLAAFRKHAGSKAKFDAFPRSVKRGILEWIAQARKPETRTKRVAETAALAAQNIRANQWSPK